jgi:peptide deformylase
MILPIVAYGDPVLKTEAVELEKGHVNLAELISNMWETMEAAEGVGLAAPQIGQSIRLLEKGSRGIRIAWVFAAS